MHSNSKDWTAPYASTSNLCPSQQGTSHYTYAYPAYESYGRVTDTYSATGYHTSYQYPATGSSDNGLLLSVTSDSFTQNDGSTFAASIKYTYNSAGLPISVRNPYGTVSVTYDSMGRVLSSIDADGVAGAVNVYNPDGSLSSTTPQGWTQKRNYTYDADGNVTTIQDSSTGYKESRWYDGFDRLVESQLPAAPFSGYSFITQPNVPLLTRFIYDLTQGNGNQLPGYPNEFLQHGNLFATQRWAGSLGGNTWTTTQENVYDALNRLTFSAAIGSCGAVKYVAGPLFCGGLTQTIANSFDASTGRLDYTRLPSGVAENFAYDARGKVTARQFNDNGTTPAETYSYDADARLATATTAAVSGSATYSYDASGRLVTKQEPSGVGSESISYSYYPNSKRSAISFSGLSFSASSPLFSYSYRSDGMLADLNVGDGANQTLWYSYSPAGRLTSRADGMAQSVSGLRYLQSITNSGATTSEVAQYDASGRVSAYAIPAGAYTSFTYTPDAQVASYTGFGGKRCRHIWITS